MLFDAVLVFGGMLTDADGFSASAFFVADLVALDLDFVAFFVADFTVEDLDADVVVELVDRGLSPGLIAG